MQLVKLLISMERRTYLMLTLANMQAQKHESVMSSLQSYQDLKGYDILENPLESLTLEQLIYDHIQSALAANTLSPCKVYPDDGKQ